MRMQWHENNSCTADWMNQWTNELMKQWMNESVNQWTSESMNQWFFPTSSSKSAPTFSVFNIWKCKSSSLKCKSSSRALATVSCTFCQPHPPTVLLRACHFVSFSSANRALATVSCTFCRPHLSKYYEFLRILTCWSANRARDNFPRSRRGTAETDTLLRRPQEPHYPKKHSVSRTKAFSPGIRMLPNCYTSELLDDGWLPWRSEC